MAEQTYYRMLPKAPFHFGERGVGLEETAIGPHSDTLFAAIVSAWRMIDGEEVLAERLNSIQSRYESEGIPPFIVSSAFPFAGEVLFLPRPLLSLPTDASERQRQTWKRIAYVSWGRMREIMFAGGVVPPVADTELLQSGQLWVTPFERAWLKSHICKRDCPEFRLWESGKKALAARVAVDRITATAALYFCGRVYYEEGCGLYLLVRYIDETYRSPLEKALLYLGEAGIGGQRNQGHGQFELQPSPNGEGYRWKKDFPAPVDAGVNSQLLLSLYHPTRKEVSAGVLNHAQYELLLRRGWIGSPDGSGVRRRGIRMLAEGAVFPDLDITGDIQDLKPKGFPHPVYRSGIAFTVPFARAA